MLPRTTLNEGKTYLMPWLQEYRNLDTGELISSQGGATYAVYVRRVRNTVNTPNFRVETKEDLPNNPFSYYELRRDYAKGWSKLINLDNRTIETYSGSGNYPVESWNSLILDYDRKASVDAQAANKSLNKLKGLKTNLGEVFGERHQTQNLLRSTALRIGNALRRLKRGDFWGAATQLGFAPLNGFNPNALKAKSFRQLINVGKFNANAEAAAVVLLRKGKSLVTTIKRPPRGKTRNRLDRLSNEWLALQYGWKPLLSDLYNGLEVLASKSDKERRYFMKSSKKFTWNVLTEQSSAWNSYNPSYRRDSGLYQVTYGYTFSYSNEVFADLKQWGVTNPYAVAWELLPWSFVIDWFIPIGNYLDTWDATVGLTFEKGFKTTFEKSKVTIVANGTVHAGVVLASVGALASQEIVDCNRYPLGGFPLPHLPSLDPKLSWTKGITAAALILQRLK